MGFHLEPRLSVKLQLSTAFCLGALHRKDPAAAKAQVRQNTVSPHCTIFVRKPQSYLPDAQLLHG